MRTKQTISLLTIGSFLASVAAGPIPGTPESPHDLEKRDVPANIPLDIFLCMMTWSIDRDGGGPKTDDEIQEAYTTCQQIRIPPPSKVNDTMLREMGV